MRGARPDASRGGEKAEPSTGPDAPPGAKEAIRRRAEDLGFDPVRFVAADLSAEAGAQLDDFIGRGYHGDMAWLAKTCGRRSHPRALWADARAIVMVGLNYGPSDDPLRLVGVPNRGAISVYAQGRDYHDVMKKRLRVLARWLHEAFGADVKLFVDTAPVMEKPLAARAGLGWQGKHTNLVSREYGSWLFLGALFTSLDLEADAPETDHCGSCRNCLDICPTDAFPAPYRLDARRCISYLTIEHKGHIAPEFRAAMGNRIYGCDDCLAVCPWNKFARQTPEHAFRPLAELTAPRLADLARVDDASFRKMFAGSPIKRVGRDRFLRNVLIALGNSGAPTIAADVERHLTDPSPLVRAMAVWALGRLLGTKAFSVLKVRHMDAETDPDVLEEWRRV